MNRQELYDIPAESIALGSMLLSEHAAQRVGTIVTAGDFFRPQHQSIFTAINMVRREHGQADAALVADYMSRDGNQAAGVDFAYLYSLTDQTPTPANGPHFAQKVRGLSVRRRLLAAVTAIGQSVHMVDDADPAEAVAGLAQRGISELEAVRDYESGDSLETMTIYEYLDIEDGDYDWIVPGLLERGDRLMLTGAEGLGKSTLLRQIAVTIAAGVHPFRATPIEPKRVLIVDAENSDTQIRRKIRPLITQARLLGFPIAEERLWVEPKVGAMDLHQDKTVSWLLKRISLIRPDVLVIGPLYKMSPRALQTDDDTAPILAALDMIRDQGVCLLMEAHAGHAVGPGGRRDFRPRGSASLMGWPEFGYGVRPSPVADEGAKERRVELVPWRGDRDEREWPEELLSGGDWPWHEVARGFTPRGNPHSRAS